MKVLVACEFSGVVREAFKAKGHDAWSCDILPTEIPGQHIQDDVLNHLDDGWDLMIAHPPCTYLTTSGNKWFKPEFKDRFPTREKDRKNAIDFFLSLANANIPKIAIENPVGIMSTVWRKPDQYIHPYYFGDPHSKKTGLWLKGLPPLVPTNVVEPKFYVYKDGRRDPMWHVESLKMPPLERMKYRSKTFQGIAKAMAEQWG
jgi:site-specific DNA-cytosine methylase